MSNVCFRRRPIALMVLLRSDLGLALSLDLDFGFCFGLGSVTDGVLGGAGSSGAFVVLVSADAAVSLPGAEINALIWRRTQEGKKRDELK